MSRTQSVSVQLQALARMLFGSASERAAWIWVLVVSFRPTEGAALLDPYSYAAYALPERAVVNLSRSINLIFRKRLRAGQRLAHKL